MIKVVTDTTCDMPPDWLSRYQITRIPVHIQFGLETYAEGLTIMPEQFYRRIEQEGVLPTTSQPSVGEFCHLYEKLINGEAESLPAGEGLLQPEILSIHLTSKLSGTWQSARLASNQMGEGVKVRVLDSWTGSVGLGLMVREAAWLAQAGVALSTIIEYLRQRRTQVRVWLMLGDLHYARMSGRVGWLQETLAVLLDIKPIIAVQGGALVLLDRVRTYRRGFRRMAAMAQLAAGEAPVDIGVAHALAPDAAEELLAILQNCLNYRNSFITDLALSVAVHLGPGTVGCAIYPAGPVSPEEDNE